MFHASVVVLWFALLGSVTAGSRELSWSPQQPRAVTQETTAVTGVIDEVDKVGRTVTIKTPDSIQVPIYVGPDLPIFDQLNRGDVVTIRYYASLVVDVTPNARMTPSTLTTEQAQKELDRDGARVIAQVKMVVTIDAIDLPGRLVTYHAADNLRVLRLVQNPQLLEGLNAGDVVTLTYTRAHAAAIEKRR